MLNNRIQKLLLPFAITAMCLLNAPVVNAQDAEMVLPILLDADSTDYDGKSSMLMFRGLRLSQGSLGIQADEGRASKLDFNDSVWHFAGNVIIDVENGHIESDVADLTFSGNQLTLATITGSPATFEMQRPDTDEITYAEAGRLEYDLVTSVVAFSEQATITEGGNQISSNYLVYNIKEQRINAQSGGDGEPKVRITYTPAESSSLIPHENGATNNAAGPAEASTPGVDPQDAAEAEDVDTDGDIPDNPGADET
jgi:lipopolysaccharide export system protein LptA